MGTAGALALPKEPAGESLEDDLDDGAAGDGGAREMTDALREEPSMALLPTSAGDGGR